MEITSYATKAEELTAKIFKEAGWKIIQPSDGTEYDKCVDVVAKKDNVDYYIEVKGSSSLMGTSSSVLRSAVYGANRYKGNNKIFILVVYYLIDEKLKSQLEKSNEGLFILDISNLLYAVRGTNLENEVIGFLPFSVEQIEYKEGSLKEFGIMQYDNTYENLLKQLSVCKAGKSDAFKFEDICYNMLNYSLIDELSLWKKQQKSNKDLYRFDLLCRIKDNTGKSFWNIVERFFNSKYVIFEFKNYTSPITQNEIYTTEKYLYKTALRNVAVIIAKNGFDENSLWAAKGALRENGKLIILLSIEELRKMCYLKYKDEDPNEVLLSKLDDLLLSLEK